MDYVIRMTYDISLCHPNDNEILILSHPDDLVIDSISSG